MCSTPKFSLITVKLVLTRDKTYVSFGMKDYNDAAQMTFEKNATLTTISIIAAFVL